jgi:hypothetical protein
MAFGAEQNQVFEAVRFFRASTKSKRLFMMNLQPAIAASTVLTSIVISLCDLSLDNFPPITVGGKIFRVRPTCPIWVVRPMKAVLPIPECRALMATKAMLVFEIGRGAGKQFFAPLAVSRFEIVRVSISWACSGICALLRAENLLVATVATVFLAACLASARFLSGIAPSGREVAGLGTVGAFSGKRVEQKFFTAYRANQQPALLANVLMPASRGEDFSAFCAWFWAIVAHFKNLPFWNIIPRIACVVKYSPEYCEIAAKRLEGTIRQIEGQVTMFQTDSKGDS